MKKLLLVLVLLNGCAVYQDMSPQEKAWQALHLVDSAQTMNIVNNDCYDEGAFLTRKIIGEQPEKERVIAWAVGSSLLHAAVSKELDSGNYPKWMGVTWQSITLIDTGYSVYNNHGNGLTTGKNCP